MKFFTSDIHLFHANICKFTDRKLVTTQEKHEEWLIELWNKQVTSADLVYILGDVSFGKYTKTKEVLEQLKGQKIVIKGNHDNEQHLNNLVKEGLIATWKHYDEIDIQGTKTCLFHFPIVAWHRQHYGSYHCFGHSHGSYEGKGKSLDVGLDSAYNIFGEHRLFTEDGVVAYMQQREIYIAEDHRKK